MIKEKDWLTEAEYGPGVPLFELLEFNRNFAVPLAVQCRAFLERAFLKLPKEVQERIKANQKHFYNIAVVGLQDLAKDWASFFGIEPPRTEEFAFSLPGEDRVWDEGQLWRLTQGIMALINTENWLPKSEIPPFFILLPEAFPEMPREVQLGGDQVLKRMFDRVYAPQPGACSEDRVAIIFDHLAPYFDEENFIDIEFKRGLIEAMLKGLALDESQSCRVLDVGCGTGLAHELKPEKWQIIGVDLSREMCARAEAKGMEVYQESVSRLHFPDEYFDAAFACCSAHWFIDWQPFREVHRVLKPGAYFFFNLFRPANGYPGIYGLALRDAGFRGNIVIIETVFPGEKEYRLPLIRAQKRDSK